MFKFLVNPSRFNKLTDIIFKPLIIVASFTLIVGFFLIYFSPLDYQQGLTVKIMYIHVPSAWLSLLTYAIMTIYSIIGLAFKIPFSFVINKAIAPIGAVFTLLCLISGSMWGKPMWGTWWVWDARIVSTLILFIMYLGLISLHDSFTDNEKADKFLAILVIVGSVNIPIIKMSVEWWSTLHQTASITVTEKPAIDPSMLYPLFGSIIGFTGIVFCLVILSSKLQILKREKNKSWVKDYV